MAAKPAIHAEVGVAVDSSPQFPNPWLVTRSLQAGLVEFAETILQFAPSERTVVSEIPYTSPWRPVAEGTNLGMEAAGMR